MPRAESDDYNTLLDTNGDRVWRLIIRILGEDGADAADCFQQAFADFVTRARRSKDIRSGGSLLIRIATARAIDVIRRRVRERGRTQELDQRLLASRRAEEPSLRAETVELLDDLRAALAELPERQSTAFVLTQIENVAPEDAAKAIGVTVAHLRVLIHRSRAALRTRLESHKPVGECHYDYSE
jgi:RNA polymerase sigma-70 factor (ECF subfamily)